MQIGKWDRATLSELLSTIFPLGLICARSYFALHFESWRRESFRLSREMRFTLPQFKMFAQLGCELIKKGENPIFAFRAENNFSKAEKTLSWFSRQNESAFLPFGSVLSRLMHWHIFLEFTCTPRNRNWFSGDNIDLVLPFPNILALEKHSLHFGPTDRGKRFLISK